VTFSHKLLTISEEKLWREERDSFNKRTLTLRDTGKREVCLQCSKRVMRKQEKELRSKEIRMRCLLILLRKSRSMAITILLP